VTRSELTAKILDGKRKLGLSWSAIAEQVGGGSTIFITAALLGQMRLDRDQAAKAGRLFALSEEESAQLAEIPYRGSLPTAVPTDPLIYRFYELVQVYGTTWKALIEEEFGDGIMSAIDFDMEMRRKPDPKGDRVEIVMAGKFLPYKRY
jgi:cyanate lyase